VNYDIWCLNPRLGWDAPSVKALMRRLALNLPDNQPIAILKRKQPTVSQKTTSKKIKVTSYKQLKSLVDRAIEVNFL